MKGSGQTVWRGRVGGRRLVALLGVAGSLLAGCSGESRTPTYPVEGALDVRGGPAPGAFLVFHPLNPPAPGKDGAEVPRPTAKVKEDGAFAVTTFEANDGAPAGDYAVTVEWYKLVGKGAEVQRGPNVIPPKYARPDSTPFKVTIREGSNRLEPLKVTK